MSRMQAALVKANADKSYDAMMEQVGAPKLWLGCFCHCCGCAQGLGWLQGGVSIFFRLSGACARPR